MRVLLVGVGTVGEAIARLSRDKPWLEHLVLADYDRGRAETVGDALGDPERFPPERVNAADPDDVAALARRHRVDVVVNAVDPRFVMGVFEGAFRAGVDYLDMAMSLSQPHAERPHAETGVMLGDEQFARADAWRAAGRLAVVGMGMDPGLSDVFAAYAAKHLFDEIDAVHVRDGGDLRVEGYPFAPVFSIWTTIEECLNPPILWERGRGWYTTEPFAEPEAFTFPEGVGPVECVHVEHEEVLLVPRWLDVGTVTFKYALGQDFIDVLRTLHLVGLDSTAKVRVGDVEVSPRDVVAAVTPDPSRLGDAMVGRAIVGTWVIGRKDGQAREVYLYQMCDARETMDRHGLQPVAWQTGFNPLVALELLSSGQWQGTGVLGPEAFDPDPYLAILERDGIHFAVAEYEPGGSGRPLTDATTERG
jgi:saccharopine dehydrogenase-like NADP-dependent oxidoreductase